MVFTRRSSRRGAGWEGPLLARALRGLILTSLTSAVRLAAVVLLLAGVVYLRLLQGPIHLAFVGDWLAAMFNQRAEQAEVEVGDFVLTLGAPGEVSGLQFVDVRVRNGDGVLLFSVPKLSAHFRAADLLVGRPWPTRIAVIRPEARLLRLADGSFRFGLGVSPRTPATEGGEDLEAAVQHAAVRQLVDGFVGDAEAPPEMSRLKRIDILGAELAYEDVPSGQVWRTRRADLRVYRTADGARAQLSIGLADGAGTGAGAFLSVAAERRRGTPETRLTGRFDRLRPEDLAAQLDQLAWLRLFDAPMAGRLEGTVAADGRIGALAGTLAVGAGRVLALGDAGEPIDGATLAFAYEPGLGRMRVSEFALTSPALQARLSGFIDMTRAAPGDSGGSEVTGLAGQLDIGAMHLELPATFSDPLDFDGGQVTARIGFAPLRIDVAGAHLRRGDLVLEVQGRAWVEDGVWHTDLRAGGRNLTVEDLLHHWPLATGEGARRWVVRNVRRAHIDEMVAHMRFVGDDPILSVDFTYSGLDTSYLQDMSLITNARGRGSLTLDTFALAVEAAEVEPVAGAPVQLAGSELWFPAINADPSPGEVSLRAAGPTASILALINEEPLRLVDKLGLDPAAIAGQSEVHAEVRLPLIDELKLDDVKVEAASVLHDFAMPFRLPNGQVVKVAGKRIDLKANIEAMHFAGDTVVDGRPLAIDWHENYGRGADQREMTFRGAATPALLARFGIGDRNFSGGEAPMELHLVQSGTPDYAFTVKADLGPAQLTVPELGWTKPPGPRGRLEASGALGEVTRIDAFTLDTDDLWATGAAELGDDGYVRSARIDQARYLGLADVTAEVTRGARDAFVIRLGGSRVDLAVIDTLPEEEGGGAGGRTMPIEMDYHVDELVVTPRLTASAASGTYRRDAGNNRKATLAGMAAGVVPFAAELSQPGQGAGELTVTSESAGDLLAAAGLFSSAQGGEMRLQAHLASGSMADMKGKIKIKGVTVHGSGTFTSILDKGGVKDAAAAARQEGGLYFDKVELPFTYVDGVLWLDGATAKGTLLAVKLEGTVDENAGDVDIVGVISPAYALTGILSSIPLIGDILSGGKDEGVLAMTFKVAGPIDAPRFTVNPLALLAPGILRNIFTGRGKKPDARFIEQLKREDE